MHLSISVSRPKQGKQDSQVSFYMDDKALRHLFGRLADIDRVYASLVSLTKVRAFRLLPLKKGELAPAGVFPVQVKTLKTPPKKAREYVVRVPVPTAWDLPLRSLTKKKVESIAGQTEESLDHCLDVPILVEWLNGKTEKAKTALVPKDDHKPDSPSPPLPDPKDILPVKDTPVSKTKDKEPVKTKEAPPMQQNAKLATAAKTLKDIPSVLPSTSKDTDDVKDILAKIEHTAGNLNMLIATAQAKGVPLDVNIKRGQVKIYRIVPAKRKRLV